MKFWTAAAVVLLSTVAAQARPATCLLVVNGLTAIDGPCDYESIGNGDFIVRSPNVDFFAYVYVDQPGRATGYWNGERGSNHAHDPLGVLFRDEACWSSGYATVCAW